MHLILTFDLTLLTFATGGGGDARMALKKTKEKPKNQVIPTKQMPYCRRDRLLFGCHPNLFLTVTWVKKIEQWIDRNQYYVTRVVYSLDINQAKIEKLKDIAERCGKLRQDLWNKYGSLQAWGIPTNSVRDCAKKVYPPESYGLPYKIWESTVIDVIDDIHAVQAAATTAVIKQLYRRVTDEKKRKEFIAKLKTTEFLSHSWLHQLVRKQYKRGHTYVSNQVIVNPGQYTVERGKNGVTWISIASLIPRKRLPLRFRAGQNTISGKLRLILKGDTVELHFPTLVWKQPNRSTATIGVDRGYTEVFYGSNNKVYGAKLGKILTKYCDARHHKGRKRNRLYALSKNTKDANKALRIKKNNLGTVKQKRKLNSIQSHIKSIVGLGVTQLFNDASTVILEDLTQHIKSKKQSKSLNRKLSNWTKGVVAEMVDNSAIRRCSTVVLVNCAYSSQVDSRNGTLLGRREGDSFFTFDGVRMQADHNAAQVIEQRANDPAITLYMSHHQVHAVLLTRTAQFLKKHEISLEDDAVQSGWLDKKHLSKQEVLRERCTG